MGSIREKLFCTNLTRKTVQSDKDLQQVTKADLNSLETKCDFKHQGELLEK